MNFSEKSIIFNKKYFPQRPSPLFNFGYGVPYPLVSNYFTRKFVNDIQIQRICFVLKTATLKGILLTSAHKYQTFTKLRKPSP